MLYCIALWMFKRLLSWAWLHGEGHELAVATAAHAFAGETLRFLFGEVGRERIDMTYLLCLVAELGWMDGVEACLTAGRADPNSALDDGTTPLLVATRRRHGGVVRALVDAGAAVERLEGHGGAVWCVAWSPDGRRVATGSRDNTARIWDATTGEVVRALEEHGDAVNSVAWSPDGMRVATGSRDNTARIGDAVTGTVATPVAEH